MPVWNQGGFLREAVDSILDQTWSDLELILIDNASTDGAVEAYCRSRTDPRLRVFRQERNLGVAAGINAGVAEARAPWIAIMDGDDRAHPRRLELELLAAECDPTLDVITAGAVNIDADGRSLGRFAVQSTPEEIAAATMFRSPMSHSTVLARREVHAAVPYRPEAQLASDYDWLSRVVERFKVGCVALSLLEYRRHPTAATIARATFLEATVCAIRLAVARRRAGRAEEFAALCSEALPWQNAGSVETAYVHFSRRAAAEGFMLLAAFHAALSCRARPSIRNRLRYFSYLVGAIRRDRGSWPAALAGLGKGPFWVMLRRAGYPSGPNY